MDERILKLAKNLVEYSCRIKEGENVLIASGGWDCIPLVRAVIKEVYAKGAYPYVEMTASELQREILLGASEKQWELLADIDAKKMKKMDAYISIGAQPNASELADVPGEKMSTYSKIYFNQVHNDIRLKKKWVVLRYPTHSMAQAAGTSLEAFEDFYYKVCCLDYSKMSKAMDKLAALMEKTDKVQIKGPGTDISFSIKGMKAIKCAGEMNIPDGEVYTAPVKTSVNGVISYNTPTEYQGMGFDKISLEFKDGKIIKASGGDDKRLNEIFDTDEGARYVGEFSFGVNPFITKPMKNILFDEKIRGSIHFTPGNAYEDADNGNRSSVHWDLVLIQTKEYGGGEIYFDDKLIRKDGLFVVESLECLNPENLM